MSDAAGTAAVVVTHNRADKVGRVIEHLLAQTLAPSTVIVVDNASTDDTPAVLDRYRDDPRVRVHRNPTNTGGAGGFAQGLRLAHAAGAAFAWLMDDDCYPAPDALERLVAGHADAEKLLGGPVAFAGSLVRWRDGSPAVMNTPQPQEQWDELLTRGCPATLVQFASFVSLLVPLAAVEAVGLPLEPYFIWFDDAEYTRRLRGYGQGIVVHDSVVLHDLAENQGVNVRHLSEASLWKFRYGLRNESSYWWHHGTRRQWAMFVLLTLVRMHRGRVAWRHRAVVVGRILAGLGFDPQPQALPRRG